MRRKRLKSALSEIDRSHRSNTTNKSFDAELHSNHEHGDELESHRDRHKDSHHQLHEIDRRNRSKTTKKSLDAQVDRELRSNHEHGNELENRRHRQQDHHQRDHENSRSNEDSLSWDHSISIHPQPTPPFAAPHQTIPELVASNVSPLQFVIILIASTAVCCGVFFKVERCVESDETHTKKHIRHSNSKCRKNTYN